MKWASKYTFAERWPSNMKTRSLGGTVLLLFSLLIAPFFCAAQEQNPAGGGPVKIGFSGPSGTFNLLWADGTSIGPIASSVELVDGNRFSTTDFPHHKVEQRKASPLGIVAPGMREYLVRYYGKSDAPELRQHIYFDTARSYGLVDLDVVSNQPLSSRKISPIILAA